MIYLMCTLKNGAPVFIKPDIDAHMDGHPILTWTYSVYRNDDVWDEELEKRTKPVQLEGFQIKELQSDDDLEKKLEERCFGFITIEEPDGKIVYTHEGEEELSSIEIEEVLEQINQYRKNSKVWNY